MGTKMFDHSKIVIKKSEATETLADKIFPEKETVSKPVPEGKEVSHYMKIFKRGRAGKKGGKLSSGSKIKSKKQAVAIGLSVARERGADVPPLKEGGSRGKGSKKGKVAKDKVTKSGCKIKIAPNQGKVGEVMKKMKKIKKGALSDLQDMQQRMTSKNKKKEIYGKWEPIPHGKHGGMRRWEGSAWEYFYPKTASAKMAQRFHLTQGEKHLGKAHAAHASLMEKLAGKKLPQASILNNPLYKDYQDNMALAKHHYSVSHNAAALARIDADKKSKPTLTNKEKEHLKLLDSLEKTGDNSVRRLTTLNPEKVQSWLDSQRKALKGKRSMLDRLHQELTGGRHYSEKAEKSLENRSFVVVTK